MSHKLYNELSESKPDVKRLGALLLDSKLITPTIPDGYNIKLVDCNDYIQVYCYEKKKKKKKNDQSDMNLIKNFDVGDIEEQEKEKDKNNFKIG